MVPSLTLLNGPPGVGKSTIAQVYVQDHPLALNLDVDLVRRQLGRWTSHPEGSGERARAIAVAAAGVHLRAGYDVIVPQYLGRVAFIEQLEQVATETGVPFREAVLMTTREEAVRRFEIQGASGARVPTLPCLASAGQGYVAQVSIHLSMWGDYGPRPEPDHRLDALFGSLHALAQIEVQCTPTAAWNLISDVTRIGEFSPECVDAWWVPGRPAGSVGGRFEGRNRRVDAEEVYEWVRPCDVAVWQPEREFSWRVGDRYDGTPSSRWSFSIGTGLWGVTLRQEFWHEADGLSGLRHMAEAAPAEAAGIVSDRIAALEDGMRVTLQRMKTVLELDSRRSA